MSDFENLKVRLVDPKSGDRLVTFDTESTIARSGHRRRQYAVEVRADQQFVIEFEIRHSFDWKGCNALEVTIGFDEGEQVNDRYVYLLKDISVAKTLDLPHLVYDGMFYSCRIDHLVVEDPQNEHKASRAGFWFRRLRSDDSIPLVKGQSRRFLNQGKIHIAVLRTIVHKSNQDSGLIAVGTPSNRRERKQYLLQRRITLEVVLRFETTTAPISYRGNFKPRCPNHANQQATFDFIYREVGFHDPPIAPSDIEEIHSHTRKSLPAVHTRARRTIPSAILSPQSTITVAVSPRVDTSIESGDTSEEHRPQPGASIMANSRALVIDTSRLEEYTSASILESLNEGISTAIVRIEEEQTRASAAAGVDCFTALSFDEQKRTVRTHTTEFRQQFGVLRSNWETLEAVSRRLKTQLKKTKDAHNQLVAKYQEVAAACTSTVDAEEVKEDYAKYAKPIEDRKQTRNTQKRKRDEED